MHLLCHLAANLVHHPHKVDGVYVRLVRNIDAVARAKESLCLFAPAARWGVRCVEW